MRTKRSIIVATIMFHALKIYLHAFMRPGLRQEPRYRGSLQRSPDALAGFKGLLRDEEGRAWWEGKR